MKRKIEEFDNYGVDLSRTCQHKTIPGGLFSITIMGVYLYLITYINIMLRKTQSQ